MGKFSSNGEQNAIVKVKGEEVYVTAGKPLYKEIAVIAANKQIRKFDLVIDGKMMGSKADVPDTFSGGMIVEILPDDETN